MAQMQTMPSKSQGAGPQISAPIHLLILLLYGMVLTLPAIWQGVFLGSDTLNHLVMSRHFADQLWLGDFYPRWLSGMNAGLGSPVFQFYGPVPYYITALFRPLLGPDPEGWRQLGVAASLAVIASGFTAYAWLKRLAVKRAALIGAVLYMSAPYHLAVDFYQRFAFAELWGFVWIPLVMLFVRSSMRGGLGGMAGLSLCYALLIMTHLPTTLLFSWVPIGFALLMAEPGERVSSFVRVAGGMLLGIGLSAIYLVPALATQRYVLFDNLKSGLFNFSNNFLFDGPYAYTLSATSSHQAVLIMLATAGLSMLAMLIDVLGRTRTHARERLFWSAIGTLTVFMMLPFSEFVWRFIPVLQTVQFPLRFNVVLVAACAVLVVLAIETALQQERKLQLGLLLCAVFGFIMPSVFALGNQLMFARVVGTPSLSLLIEKYGPATATLNAVLSAAKISRYNSFLPKWSNPDLFANTPEAVLAMTQLAISQDKVSIVKGKGNVVVQGWQPPNIDLVVKAETTLLMNFHQFYYPGWVARLDNGAIRLPVNSSSPDGLLEVQVPPGNHRVWITREVLPEERAGQMVSGVSLFALASLLFWGRIRLSLN